MRFEPGNNFGKDSRFRPGESGNPRGRRRAAASIREWWNTLMEEDDQGAPRYTVRDLWNIAEAAADDRTMPPAKRAAARMVLELVKGGRAAREVAALIFDRTEGRRAQSINLSAQLGVDPAREITEQTLDRIRSAAGQS